MSALMERLVSALEALVNDPGRVTLNPDSYKNAQGVLAEARVFTGKIAPVQGYPSGIPWSMHLRAYDVYCKKWAPQPAMIDLEGRNCRGGFSVGELDDFIPGWREELRREAAIFVSEGELSRALADTVLSPDESFDAQAVKLMAVIRANKGKPAPR